MFSSLINSVSSLPVEALLAGTPILLNVLCICLSKSILSVAITTCGFFISLSSIIFLVIYTIVIDLPEPCVCQTTPPLFSSFILFSIAFTAKYC